MNENITAEILQHGEYKIIELDNCKFLVFKTGTIYRWVDKNRGFLLKTPHWKLTNEMSTNSKGYSQITMNCKGKKIGRHRIICYAFKNLDIMESKTYIDHIDHNKLVINKINLIEKQLRAIRIIKHLINIHLQFN
jgi:hypothetical protein